MTKTLKQPDLPLVGPQGSELLPDELRQKVGLVLPQELATALNATEQTLASWRSTNQGPDFVKLGKGVFYRIDDIRAWVNRRVTTMNVA